MNKPNKRRIQANAKKLASVKRWKRLFALAEQMLFVAQKKARERDRLYDGHFSCAQRD